MISVLFRVQHSSQFTQAIQRRGGKAKKIEEDLSPIPEPVSICRVLPLLRRTEVHIYISAQQHIVCKLHGAHVL